MKKEPGKHVSGGKAITCCGATLPGGARLNREVLLINRSLLFNLKGLLWTAGAKGWIHCKQHHLCWPWLSEALYKFAPKVKRLSVCVSVCVCVFGNTKKVYSQNGNSPAPFSLVLIVLQLVKLQIQGKGFRDGDDTGFSALRGLIKPTGFMLFIITGCC